MSALDLGPIKERAAKIAKPWEGCTCGIIPHREGCPRSRLGDVLDIVCVDVPTMALEIEVLRTALAESLDPCRPLNFERIARLRALLPAAKS